MTDAASSGRFVWFDLMTSDVPRAIDFYSKVVPWGTQAWKESETPYTMWTAGASPIGGVMALDASMAGVPPHWIGYVAVPNADEAAQQAVSLGATALAPAFDIPTVGRVAMIADPQGAVIGLFAALADAPGHEGPANMGEISWHELLTSDNNAALDFYQRMFGWGKGTAMDMGPQMGTYQIFERGGAQYGGMMARPPQMPVSAWTFYARVPDIRAARELVLQHGGTLMYEPMQVPGGGWVFAATDPQGAMFALHQA